MNPKNAPAPTVGKHVHRAHDEHPLVEAATLVGTAGGFAVGAIAGPIGAAVGGAIGMAAGALAGDALERDEDRASDRQRSLDEAIGVEGGDLGARESASSALTALDKGSRPDGQMHVASGVLREEHARLETIYEALLAAYRSGEWNDVRAEWTVFEPTLRAHMEREEREVFPALRESDPAVVTTLLAEHDELRRLLSTLGVAIDLHAVPEGDAEILVERLRAHGQQEETLLYPWMDRARS